jgi:hypothetical protein
MVHKRSGAGFGRIEGPGRWIGKAMPREAAPTAAVLIASALYSIEKPLVKTLFPIRRFRGASPVDGSADRPARPMTADFPAGRECKTFVTVSIRIAKRKHALYSMTLTIIF